MNYDITFCSDKKCLRTVCHRHLKQLEGKEVIISVSSFIDCPDRIHMKGDDGEEQTKCVN